MDLSVVIACSRPGFITACLQGFARQTGSYKFEIIVAGKVSGLPALPLPVQLLQVDEQHPNTKRNRGIALAQANLIALLDDDTIPCTNWVQTAVETARAHAHTVLTGPETAYPTANHFAQLTHQLLSLPVAEFTKAHIHSKLEPVKWFDAPFCNCVFSKQMWQQVGGLSETIPWHMDDFHFFFPFRHNTAFLNVPQLSISHNRYPESLRALVQYKWRLRTETGEKLISHPEIYRAVTPVLVAVAISLVFFVLLTALLFIQPVSLLFLIAAYILLLLCVSMWRIGWSKPGHILRGVCILGAVQLVTVAGLYYGMLRGAFISMLKQTAF